MNDKMSDKLLPCPFCGGEAEVVGGNPYHWVFCKTCDVESGQSATIEGAIRKWNTRIPAERVLERLEERCNCSKDDYGMERHSAYVTAIEIVKEEM